MLNWFKGKKTYFLAGAAVAYAVGGLVTGHMDLQTAITILYSSGVVSSLRAGIASHQHTVNAAINTLIDINNAQQAVQTIPMTTTATTPTVVQ